MTTGPLAGRCIGITADRKRDVQRRLLEARGAVVVEGPTMTSRSLVDDEVLRAATVGLLAEPPDIVVADTGIGMRTWFEAARSWGLDDGLRRALARARLYARGAKAASAVRSIAGVAAETSPDARLDGLRVPLAAVDLTGRTVAIQRSGADDEPFVDWLRGRGAHVWSIQVYRWALPDDRGPAHALIRRACARDLDAVTFTSAPAVENLFTMSSDLGLRAELLAAFESPMLAVCIGSVCAEAAQRAGIRRPVHPQSNHLPDMVRLIEELLRSPRA